MLRLPSTIRRVAVVPSFAVHAPAVLVRSFASAEFLKAKESVLALPSVDNAAKLRLYALFKAATEGPNKGAKPGAFDFVAKAKWQAWTDVSHLSQAEAEKEYIAFAKSLGANVDGGAVGGAKVSTGGAGAAGGAAAAAPVSKDSLGFETVATTLDNGVFTVTFNRPAKRNAINLQMYEEIMSAFKHAESNAAVKVMLLTGAGDFYSSGNDLSNFTNIPPEGPAKMAKDARHLLERFVNHFITFPKPLLAAVNGPAVGIPVTTLGLCDIVYASHKATFHTPFSSLGQSPEACSSYVFPAIMGWSRANEMLLLGSKLSAEEAREAGLVARVFEHSVFQDEVKQRAATLAALPPKSLAYSKSLIRSTQVETLKKINFQECERLEERWLSEECMNAIMQFMGRKK